MKIVKKIALALLAVLIAMQLYRPEKNSTKGDLKTTFLTETNPPPVVRSLLENACYDCHSNNTSYPWYNYIAPVSYWMAGHVNHGKEELNFSEWEVYTKKKKDHKLEEIIEMIEEDEMPLKEYRWTHDAARLTAEQKEAIMEWAQLSRALYQLNDQPQ